MHDDIENIKNSPDAIKHLVSIFNNLQKNLSHHEFDCVMAYIKEKYIS